MTPVTEQTTLLPLAARRTTARFPFLVDCFCCLSPEQNGCLVHPTKSDAFALLSLVFAALTFCFSIEGMSLTVAGLGIMCVVMAYCNHVVSSHQTTAIKEDIGTMKVDIGTMKGDIGTMKGDIGTMKESIGTMKEDIGTMGDSMNTMNDKIDAMNDKIDKLPTLSAIEASIKKAMSGDKAELQEPDDLLKNPHSQQRTLQKPDDHSEDPHGEPDDHTTTFDVLLAPGKSENNNSKSHEDSAV
jgi:hypothetical protein